MKKLVSLVGLFLLFGGVAFADPEVIQIPSSINLKQGFLLKWNDPTAGVLNLSTVTLLETKPWDKLGSWNILWDGWSADLGWSFDANTSSGALMLGRHLGTLGKYIPLSYPLADKIDITLYPVGIIVDDPFGHPDVHGASGVGIIKLSVNF